MYKSTQVFVIFGMRVSFCPLVAINHVKKRDLSVKGNMTTVLLLVQTNLEALCMMVIFERMVRK